jgi:aryl-alcohol dehydrogenase-like predicted oxidoreductase
MSTTQDNRSGSTHPRRHDLIDERAIGRARVSTIGLGCAGLSLNHAGNQVRASRTIHAALRFGITLFDTALAYTPAGQANHNEKLLSSILSKSAGMPPVLIATKGGHYRDGDTFPIDARPHTLRAHCESSLRALGVERIDLYFLHWPDPHVPIEDSVGAIAELQREGKIDQIGVSNVDPTQLRRAQRVADIAAVENRLSVFDQTNLDILEDCTRTGVAFLAYSPLGGAGRQPAIDAPGTLATIARDHGAPPAQVALAWLLALSPQVIPIVGATRPVHVDDTAHSVEVTLSAAEIDALTLPRRTRRQTIRIDLPAGIEWQPDGRIPEIESIATMRDQDSKSLRITLKDHIDERRMDEIVRSIRATLGRHGDITVLSDHGA